jgi:hypothetical protein
MRNEKRSRFPLAVLIVASLSVVGGKAAVAQPIPPEPPQGTLPASFAAETMASDSIAVDSLIAPSVGASVTVVPTGARAEKPGLAARLGRAAGNFGSDVWIVSTSPLRLRGKGLLLTAAVLGTEAVIYANDQEILDAIVRNRDEPVLKETIDVGTRIEPVGFMGRTNAIYMAALGAGYALNVRPLRTIPTEILESHFIAGGVRNLAKLLVGRQHPSDGKGPYDFKFGHGTSFPSGHTSVVYELATIATMNTHSVPVGIASYSLATALAIQRVESLNHWPSDVFIAAVYGTLVARTVVQQHEKRERGLVQGMLILPHIDERGELVGVRVSRTF